MPPPLFKPADLISEYNDADGVDDGMLIPLSRTDRVTHAVFVALEEGDRGDSAGPGCNMPVPLMQFVAAKNAKERACCYAFGLIDSWRGQAERADQATERRIYSGHLCFNADGMLVSFTEGPRDPDAGDCRKVWFVVNELGGITLMYPSDY